MTRSDYCIDFEAIHQVDQNSSNVYWHVIDQIAFMDWPNADPKLKEALEIAPEGVRLFYLIRTIEAPVEDGGFGQYFSSRRPTWLHEMAKKAILEFGFPQIAAIITEAEQYFNLNQQKLPEGISWEEWVKVMGVVPMNKALDNIHDRFFQACKGLHEAREEYLRRHPERFQ